MTSEFILGQYADGTERTARARVFGRWIHVLRCLPAEGVTGVRGGVVAMADVPRAADACEFHEILAVGEKCRYFTPAQVGQVVLLPARPIGKKGWSHIVAPDERMVREEMWEANPEIPLCTFKETA